MASGTDTEEIMARLEPGEGRGTEVESQGKSWMRVQAQATRHRIVRLRDIYADTFSESNGFSEVTG